MKTPTPDGLFLDTRKDIDHAERKILNTLPGMACASRSHDLRAAFEKYKRETDGQPALDAGLLASARAVEHYEMARTGTPKSRARSLGVQDAADLPGQTLAGETAADEALTTLAEGWVNAAALEAA